MYLVLSFSIFVTEWWLITIIHYKYKQLTARLLAFFIIATSYSNLLLFLWGSYNLGPVSPQRLWLVTAWFSLLMCGVLWLALFFLPEVLYGPYLVNRAEPVTDKPKNNNCPPDTALQLTEKLMAFIEEKGFLQKQLKLADLASCIEVQPYVLSAYLNQAYQMRFTDFINFHRIRYASEVLASGEWESLTLEAIGEKAGFTNRTTFLNAFKKHIGTTPTLFLLQQKLGMQPTNQLPDRR